MKTSVPALDPCRVPDLRHLRRLTTDFGIYQHTAREQPLPEFGCALDDVARALIVVVETGRLFEKGSSSELVEIYLRFIEYCQLPDGRFHNFVAHDRSFHDDAGSLDAYGRTLWALGICLRHATKVDRVARLLQRALPHVGDIPSLRSKAFTLLGLLAALQATESSDQLPGPSLLDTVSHLAGELVHSYEDAATPDWPWFEDILTYSNAALPYALLVAARNSKLQTLNSELTDRAREIGLQSLEFLLRECSVDGVPAPVGNKGWYPRGGTRALYDQQCVDAAAMVVASAAAFQVTKERRFRDAAYAWWAWFFGNNTNHRPLYRPEDGAVYDGLTPEGVNENRGAESVLAFLLAHLSLAGTFCHERAA